MKEVGEVINSLKILDRDQRKIHNRIEWYYKTQCLKCGTISIKSNKYFIYGCWFCNKRIPDENIRNVFNQMKHRCYTNHEYYKYWNGKGIKICEEWLENPLKFYEWCLNNGYKKGLSIDRKDSNKNYSPENCQWITVSENSKKVIHKKL